MPGGASLHNQMSAHGPDRASYDKALARELKPHYIADALAFMFESRYVFEPTAFALSTPALDRDYDAVWNGFAESQRSRNEARVAEGPVARRDAGRGEPRPRARREGRCDRAHDAVRARELGHAVAEAARRADVARESAPSATRSISSEALAGGKVAAPLPRAYEWLDGSAYLSHVERVRRARNDKVPESFYKDPLMYQGGAGMMMGPRDPIRVISEDWGVDLEGEVCAIVGDVPMGATPEQARRSDPPRHAGERRVVPPPHSRGAREGIRIRERQGRQRAGSRGGHARRAGRAWKRRARAPTSSSAT